MHTEQPVRVTATVTYASRSIQFSTLCKTAQDCSAWIKRVMADNPLAIDYSFVLI